MLSESCRPMSAASCRPVSGASYRPVSVASCRSMSGASYRPVSVASCRPVSRASCRPVSDASCCRVGVYSELSANSARCWYIWSELSEDVCSKMSVYAAMSARCIPCVPISRPYLPFEMDGILALQAQNESGWDCVKPQNTPHTRLSTPPPVTVLATKAARALLAFCTANQVWKNSTAVLC